MVLGAVAAINQENIKRLMAYSSIGHVGYALVGLAAGTREGVVGVLVYMAIYLVMNVGTFGCILLMRQKGRMVEGISDLAGLAKTKPAMAAALAILMFSMAGIPPMAGFLRQAVRVPGRGQCGPLLARRHRRRRQRGVRLLLSAHHQGDVFRRARGVAGPSRPVG